MRRAFHEFRHLKLKIPGKIDLFTIKTTNNFGGATHRQVEKETSLSHHAMQPPPNGARCLYCPKWACKLGYTALTFCQKVGL